MTDESEPLGDVADRFFSAAPPKTPKGPKPKKPKPSGEPAPTKALPDLENVDAAIDWINQRYAVVPVGRDTVILYTPPSGPPVLKDAGAVALKLANKWVTVETEEGPRRRQAFKVWLTHPRRREYAGLEFEPQPGMGQEGWFNTWTGFAVSPKEGRCDLLIRHLFEVYCGRDPKLYAWVLQWLALGVQQPWVVPGVALVIVGERGVGKTMLAEFYAELFGHHALRVDSADLIFGTFNGILAHRVVLVLEEGFWAGRKDYEGRIKNLITGRTLTIQNKGIDAYPITNHTKLIITSNEAWVVPAGADERRYLALNASSQKKGDYAYFEALRAEWQNGGREAFLYLLQHEPITLNLREAPRTSALLEQKIASFDPVPRWWYGRLQDGIQTKHKDRWEHFVTKDELYTDYLLHARDADIGRPGTKEDMSKVLRKLCPALEDHRPNEGRRPRGFLFPTLAACRESLERHLGQNIDWEDDGPTDPADSP